MQQKLSYEESKLGEKTSEQSKHPVVKSFEQQVLMFKSHDFLDDLLNTDVLDNKERYNSELLVEVQQKKLDHKEK